MKINMEEQMNNIKVKALSETEVAQTWQAIASRLTGRQPVQSSFPLFLLFKSKFMLGMFITIALVLSGAFTVQAADKARPGDWLFPLDRTIEEVQLKLADENKQQELKLKFAAERVAEVDSLISEVTAKLKDKSEGTSRLASDSKGETDSVELPLEDKEKLADAWQVAFDFVSGVQSQLATSSASSTVSLLSQLLDSLENEIDYFPGAVKLKLEAEGHEGKVELEFSPRQDDDQGKVEIKIKSDSEGDKKIEIEGFTNEGKIHYKVEDDGSTEIESKDKKIDDHGEAPIPYGDDGIETEVGSDDSDSGRVDNDSADQAVVDLREIKVKVEGDKAEVKVDFVGGEHKFILTYIDNDSLIKQIADRYKVDIDLIKSITEIEFESGSHNSDD